MTPETNPQADLGKLVEALLDPNYAKELQHLRSWSEIDNLFTKAASTLQAQAEEIVRLRGALDAIRHGYGVNHTSKWCRDTARYPTPNAKGDGGEKHKGADR